MKFKVWPRAIPSDPYGDKPLELEAEIGRVRSDGRLEFYNHSGGGPEAIATVVMCFNKDAWDRWCMAEKEDG